MRFLALLLALAAPLLAARSDRHVVLISLDGFPAYLWRDPALPLPNLRQLAAAGASANAMTVSKRLRPPNRKASSREL